MEFIRLFETITINGLEIKNRIVMPAMGLLYTGDYTLTDRHRAFYLNSFRLSPINEPTATEGAWRTGCASVAR